ncbi:hypothetical protein FXO38_03693 [Capsicum annuum]|nr:hypothetical protein FXO38_03693 [Capsicum annuum]
MRGVSSTSVEEEFGRVFAGVKEELSGASSTTASNVPILVIDWKSASENSGYGNLFDEIDNEYSFDVEEENKIGIDELYVDSNEEYSFEIDTNIDVDDEDEVQQPVRSGEKSKESKKT